MLTNKSFLFSGTLRIHSNLHINTFDSVSIVFLALVATFTFLWNFDTAVPMQFWDESRNANNALEMALKGNWLIPTYNELPDHWNTKPPLLIGMMALGIKLGLSPLFAIRLPSLLALISTLIMVWGFLYCVLKDRLAAPLACILILSSTLYIGVHGARTGDYDALLAFFTTAYTLSFWCFAANKNALKFNWLILTGVLVFGAVMTKGIAGFFGLVGIALFCVLNGFFLTLVKSWRFWLILGATLASCISYYLIREVYDHGYLTSVWGNELGGRYFETNESHYKGSYYYLARLSDHFEPGFLCILFAVFVRKRQYNFQAKTIERLCFLVGLGLLLVLTAAKTQLSWYALPIVPVWSIAAAIAISDAISTYKQKNYSVRKIKIVNALVVSCLLILIINFIYQTVIYIPNRAMQCKDPNAYGNLFKSLHADQLMPKNLIVVDGGVDEVHYNPVLRFYTRLENLKGFNVSVSNNVKYDHELIASCDKAKVAEIKYLQLHIVYDNGLCILARTH